MNSSVGTERRVRGPASREGWSWSGAGRRLLAGKVPLLMNSFRFQVCLQITCAERDNFQVLLVALPAAAATNLYERATEEMNNLDAMVALGRLLFWDS